MEYMIAWYPTVKLIVGIVVILSAVQLFRMEKYKSSLALIALAGWFYTMIPVKIDGTESVKAHQIESQAQDSKYKYQAEEAVTVTKPVLTFDEQMAIVDAKNEVKNKKIEEGLK